MVNKYTYTWEDTYSTIIECLEYVENPNDIISIFYLILNQNIWIYNEKNNTFNLNITTKYKYTWEEAYETIVKYINKVNNPNDIIKILHLVVNQGIWEYDLVTNTFNQYS